MYYGSSDLLHDGHGQAKGAVTGIGTCHMQVCTHTFLHVFTPKKQIRMGHYNLISCSMAWKMVMSEGKVSLKFILSPSAVCSGTCPNSLARVNMDWE